MPFRTLRVTNGCFKRQRRFGENCGLEGPLWAASEITTVWLRKGQSCQEPTSFSDQGNRRIVHQVWNWSAERRYAFHLYITREVQGCWEAQHYVSNYRAILREECNRILQAAGFVGCRWFLTDGSGFYQPIVLARQNSTP